MNISTLSRGYQRLYWLATGAIFFSAGMNLVLWLANAFLPGDPLAHLLRADRSLWMGLLMLLFGALVLRKNMLALLLAIGLSMYDLFAGACASLGSNSAVLYGECIRGLLFFMIVPGILVIRPIQERRSKPKRDDEPEADKEEPLHPPVAPLPSAETAAASEEILAAEGTISEANQRSGKSLSRFVVAMIGLVILLCIGLGFFIWKTFFFCDPRIPWDMQAGCAFQQQPPPEAFPLEDVRQLTFEATYYENLMWSPSGKYILAEECEVIQRRAECYTGSWPILIEIDTGELHVLDFVDSYPQATEIRLYPHLWSEDGKRLLLSISLTILLPEQESSTPGQVDETDEDLTVLYDVTTGQIQELENVQGIPVAWLEDQDLFLSLKFIGRDEETHISTWAFGWEAYETGVWQEEVRFTNKDWSGRTQILSPDRQILLLGDDLSNSDCHGELIEYRIGSGEIPEPSILNACYPAYSPDGSRLAYAKDIQGDIWPRGVWIAKRNGTDAIPFFTLENPEPTSSIAWSPDGAQIAFTYGFQYNAIYVMDVPSHLKP